MFCYANIGVPKNPNNPFYEKTDPTTNPYGYNPLGAKYIDYGLGLNPNPAPDGTRFYKTTPGDIHKFRGLFKAPSVRNSDKRPYADVREGVHAQRRLQEPPGGRPLLQQAEHRCERQRATKSLSTSARAPRPATRRCSHRPRSSTTSRTSPASPPPRRPPKGSPVWWRRTARWATSG